MFAEPILNRNPAGKIKAPKNRGKKFTAKTPVLSDADGKAACVFFFHPDCTVGSGFDRLSHIACKFAKAMRVADSSELLPLHCQ